ncbi:hypothetical protein D3C72_2331940 [compost metagenome]
MLAALGRLDTEQAARAGPHRVPVVGERAEPEKAAAALVVLVAGRLGHGLGLGPGNGRLDLVRVEAFLAADDA